MDANPGLFIVCVCVDWNNKILHITYSCKITIWYRMCTAQCCTKHNILEYLRRMHYLLATKAIVPCLPHVLIPHSQICSFCIYFLPTQLSQLYLFVFCDCTMVLWETCVWMMACYSSLTWPSLIGPWGCTQMWNLIYCLN